MKNKDTTLSEQFQNLIEIVERREINTYIYMTDHFLSLTRAFQ